MNKTTYKPTIAIDIDDVLSDWGDMIIQYFCDVKGIYLEPSQTTENWSKMLGVSDEQGRIEFAKFATSDYVTKKLKPLPGSYEALKRLKSKYQLVILTSRSIWLRDTTLDWLNKYFKDIFDEVYFSGVYDNDKDLDTCASLTKSDKLRGIGVEYLIDDQPKHANAAVGLGVKALLFGDFGWNRDTKILPGVVRVTDWGGVADYFGV